MSHRMLFAIAAVYDGVLGLLFLVAPRWAFLRFEVPEPNHYGYVRFPAALLLVFTLMFISIAARPRERRHLIIYGILLKISYASVVLGYWFTSGVPGIWKPFAVVDVLMAVLFAGSYVALGKAGTSGPA